MEKQILIFTKCQSKPSVMSSLFKETTVVNWNILIEFLGKTKKERESNVKIMIEVKTKKSCTQCGDIWNGGLGILIETRAKHRKHATQSSRYSSHAIMFFIQCKEKNC